MKLVGKTGKTRCSFTQLAVNSYDFLPEEMDGCEGSSDRLLVVGLCSLLSHEAPLAEEQRWERVLPSCLACVLPGGTWPSVCSSKRLLRSLRVLP